MAGSALIALDDLVQAAPEGRGAWRHRLASKAAGACMKLIGRSARTKRHCATPGMAAQPERLRAVAPKLRSRPPAMSLDGCSATMCGVGNVDQKNLSCWASRRLFDRLVEHDAARELSGRSTFRIYGP